MSSVGPNIFSGGKHLSFLSLMTNEKFSMSSHFTGVRKVNDYLLKARISKGGSSRVYLAIETSTRRQYAVKRVKLDRLSRSASGIPQLEREIRLMSTWSHPNILKLKEVLLVEAEREVYLVLEYAKRGSLCGYLDGFQRLTLPSIFSILKQTITAVKYLHDNGFQQPDIKPWNIMVDATGRAILADYGIGHSFQTPAMIVGSPSFQAPEALDDDDGDVIRNRPWKEDVWALGVILYQLLFLKLPFAGESLYEIVDYIREHSLEIPLCDPGIEALLRRMLVADPAARISIEELIAHPIIKDAPDLAGDLPPVPEIEPLEGEIYETQASVCPPGMSFVSIVSRRDQIAFMHTYSPRELRDRSLPGVRPRLLEVDSSCDDELVMSSPAVIRK
jgi:serine/threonine protein kinase